MSTNQVPSKKEIFALEIMAGLVANPNVRLAGEKEIVKKALSLTDKLLAALES